MTGISLPLSTLKYSPRPHYDGLSIIKVDKSCQNLAICRLESLHHSPLWGNSVSSKVYLASAWIPALLCSAASMQLVNTGKSGNISSVSIAVYPAVY